MTQTQQQNEEEQKQRLLEIEQFLTQTLATSDYRYEFAGSDASFRRYARVWVNHQTYMLMDAPPSKEDCRPFVKIDEFLGKHGVNVPQIIAKSVEQGLLLLQDFGDVTLALVLNADTVDAYYLQSFKQIVHLQSIDATDVLVPYSAEKLLEEMNLMPMWLLPALGIDLKDDKDARKIIADTFAMLVDSALAQPQVIVHRDYHSRNLMKIAEQDELGVIDFQDAVIGADTYDLISIIRDAYRHWSEPQIERWTEQFYDLLPASSKEHRSLDTFKKQADFMALQRHLKILGIFVRLSERDGKHGYLNDLPLVMWYVRHLLSKHSELASFRTWFENTVVEKFHQKYTPYQSPYSAE